MVLSTPLKQSLSLRLQGKDGKSHEITSHRIRGNNEDLQEISTSSKKPWWIFRVRRRDDESQTGNAGSPGTHMAGQIAGRIEFTPCLPYTGITVLGSPTDRAGWARSLLLCADITEI
jgi:hypothetical protein